MGDVVRTLNMGMYEMRLDLVFLRYTDCNRIISLVFINSISHTLAGEEEPLSEHIISRNDDWTNNVTGSKQPVI